MRDSGMRGGGSKGFTLIEVVLTIMILAIISGIAATVVMQGLKSFSGERARHDIQYQANLALERMVREIRTIRSATAGDLPTMTGTTLLFNDVNGTPLGFRLNAGNIERTQDGGFSWQALATGMTGVSVFTYLDAGGAAAGPTALWLVQIEIAATQGTESTTLRTSVHPMNL